MSASREGDFSPRLAAFAAGLRSQDIPAPVLRRAQGADLDVLAQRQLFGPLGIERFQWRRGGDGKADQTCVRHHETPAFMVRSDPAVTAIMTISSHIRGIK